MEKTPKRILGIALVIVVIAGLGVYAYVQSREYLRGPVLVITEPENGASFTSSRTTLVGEAKNISFLTLNGRRIFTDERGLFKETILLPEGYSIHTLEAKDRFGHTVEKRLELVYKQTSTTSPSVIPAETGIQYN
jgi:hypothetical protein